MSYTENCTATLLISAVTFKDIIFMLNPFLVCVGKKKIDKDSFPLLTLMTFIFWNLDELATFSIMELQTILYRALHSTFWLCDTELIDPWLCLPWNNSMINYSMKDFFLQTQKMNTTCGNCKIRRHITVRRKLEVYIFKLRECIKEWRAPGPKQWNFH